MRFRLNVCDFPDRFTLLGGIDFPVFQFVSRTEVAEQIHPVEGTRE
jgi:hypothetical protein